MFWLNYGISKEKIYLVKTVNYDHHILLCEFQFVNTIKYRRHTDPNGRDDQK